MDKKLEDVKYGISKYNNTGITCYINSILAILQQTPIFADYILHASYKDKIKSTDSILFQLFNVLNLSHSYDNYNINPDTFRKVISLKNKMWGYNQQQDTQEFLSFLLNSIEEEIGEKVQFIPGRIINNNSMNNSMNITDNLINIMANNSWQKFIKNEFSIMKNLFGGMNHIIITCSNCNNKSHNFDYFHILQLNCSDSLSESLDEFTKEEVVDKDNMIKCDLCGHYNKSTKQTKFWKLPKILIIQFKRFNNSRIKNTKMIDYPMNLILNNYYYKLFAVNNHHSNSITSGHYTSTVINRFDNKWYIFNDTNELEETTDIITKNAYNLFYILE